MSSLIGSNDSSVETLEGDLFEISQYVKGLSEFVKSCVTPMTISIQGDWGSGKTSIMNMVKENLGDNVIPIWFNTWQYSQFNLGDDLALSFMSKMIAKLRTEESSKKANEIFKKVYKAFKKAGYIAVDHFVGGAAAEEIEQLASKFAQGDDDVVEAINSLREEFESAVSAKLEEVKKDRVVIFIDDLDRLNPGKAVELLEVLKLFLDCDKCVFVLAIDYSVVSKGVKEKYGDLLGDDKGRSFFDKIIQVPFKMPVSHYKLEKFVTDMFNQVGIPMDDYKEAATYVKLIESSVGCNPRTMKRLFNAYLLLMCISKNVEISEQLQDSVDGAWYRKILFATLCCQHAFEDLYVFMVHNRDLVVNNEGMNILKNPKAYNQSEKFECEPDMIELVDLLQDEFKDASDDYIARMTEFIEAFIEVIDKDGNHELDEDTEIKAVSNLLKLTAITAATTENEDGSSSLDNKSEKKIKRAAYVYNGKNYKSGGRKQNNIGYLVHDMLKDCITNNKWTSAECIKFRDIYCSRWKTGWLHEVLILEDEVLRLPSDTDWWEKTDDKDVYGNELTMTMESFGHRFVNILNPSPSETVTYGMEDIVSDAGSILLSDGKRVFSAKYFGDKDIDKVQMILKEEFGVELSYERVDLR